MNLSEEGTELLDEAEFVLTLPDSAEPIDDGNGGYQWIKLAGPESDIIREIDRKWTNWQNQMRSKNQKWQIPYDAVLDHLLNKVCSATTSWNVHITLAGYEDAGEHPECTPAHVKAFFTQRPFGQHFREEAFDFMQRRANFLLKAEKPSSTTHAINSGQSDPMMPKSQQGKAGGKSGKTMNGHMEDQPMMQ